MSRVPAFVPSSRGPLVDKVPEPQRDTDQMGALYGYLAFGDNACPSHHFTAERK